MCSTLRSPLSSSKESPAAKRLFTSSNAMPFSLLIKRTSSPAFNARPMPESVMVLAPCVAECSRTGAPVTVTIAPSAAKLPKSSGVSRKFKLALAATVNPVSAEKSVTFQ